MTQLYLKIQSQILTTENVIKFKRDERNNIIDEIKKFKKDKDAVATLKTKRGKIEQELVDLEHSLSCRQADFEYLKHKMGKIRLNLYLFSDVIYNTLIEYREFLDKYVINKDDDNATFDTLTQAIDHAKKLPFSMADNEYTNNFYNAVTDKFIERWIAIRDGVVTEILKEVDNENIKNKLQ